MSRFHILHAAPGFASRSLSDWIVLAFEWEDARHVFKEELTQPVRLRVELLEADDTTSDIHIFVDGGPRQTLELLPAAKGFCAVADLGGIALDAICQTTSEIIDHPLSRGAITIETGEFGSDDPEAPGYLDAHLTGCLETPIRAHVDNLSNHRVLALKATRPELLYLARGA